MLFSVKRATETDTNPGPALMVPPTKFVTIVVAGQRHPVPGTNAATLVKKFSATNDPPTAGVSPDLLKNSLLSANPGNPIQRQSLITEAGATGGEQTTSLPPRLQGGSSPIASTEGLTSVRTTPTARPAGGEVLRTDTSLSPTRNVMGGR